MIRRVVVASLKFRSMVVAGAALLVVFGITRFGDMPVDVLPEFSPPMVEVQTEALGLSAEEVESLITLNLEELLSGVSWLESIRSESVPGMSKILMIFEPGTDVMRARQLVQERLTLAYTLPNVSNPPVMIQPLSATNRVMMIGLSSTELSGMDLSVLARWTIKPRLMGITGVANVAVWGHRERQLQVQVDPLRLQAAGLTQDQIIRTTGDALWVSPLSFLSASFPGTGGWIDTPNQRLGIQHMQPISTPAQLADIPVDGADMRLGDVATVVEGHPLLIGDALIGDGEGLLLVVEKFPGISTLAVTRDLDAALAALRPGLPGVTIDADVFRAAGFIESALGNLPLALLLGGVLAFLALVTLLFTRREAVVVALTIPLSLFAAIAVLYLTDATFNVMLLAGLAGAIGVILDDVITDTGRIANRLRGRAEGSEGASTVVNASLEGRGPLLSATLMILLTALPVFFLQGTPGAFFQPLVISYGLAVIASLVVALLVTPALAFMLLRGTPREAKDPPILRAFERVFGQTHSRALGAPRLAMAGVGVVLVAGAAAWYQLPKSLVPTFQERHLVVDWTAAPGVSHPAANRLLGRAGQELRALPGVSHVGTHLGRAITGDQVVNINSGQLWVTLDGDADYDAAVENVRSVVTGYPGVRARVQSYLNETAREALTGARDEIVVRLYGPRRDVLQQKAEEVRLALASIDGIVDLQVEGQAEEAQIEVQVDLAKAQLHGLKPGDVRRQTGTVFAGLLAGNLFEEQKVFEVVVWGTPETRQHVDNVKDFMLQTPRGDVVRLADVADVKLTMTPTVIHHEAISPRIDVVANVRGRALDPVIDQVEQSLAGIQFPLEYNPELLGEYAARESAERRLLSVAIAAAIGILLLLQVVCGNWMLASVLFLVLPVSAVGSLLATAMGGGVLALGSVMGIFAVLAIAIRNSVSLVAHFRRLENDEGGAFGPELVARGTRERAAPILGTALVTAAVMLPLVVLGGSAGLEILHSLAVAVLGGLVTSTWLNLHVVPALYLRFGEAHEPDLGLDTFATESA